MMHKHLKLNLSDFEINSNDPVQVSPKKGNETSNINIKMMSMRERFKMLQLEEPDDTKNIDETETPTILDVAVELPTSASSKGATAANRWSKLRKVVRTDSDHTVHTKNSFLTPRLEDQPKHLEDIAASIELEDIKLMEFWNSATKADVTSEEKPIEQLVSLEMPQSSAALDFEIQSKPVSVTVNRIPESVVNEQREKVQLSLYEEQSKVLDGIKRKEVDVIWREHLARDRLAGLEAESRRKIEAEREKLVELSKEKEALLGRDFRKVREELEVGLRRQQGAVKENFGQVLAHEEVLTSALCLLRTNHLLRSQSRGASRCSRDCCPSRLR